jgi:hypothetical protein
MAHSPPKFIPGVDPFSQPKTLFLPAPGKVGILVTRTAKSMRSRPKRFMNAHAALAWCQENSAALVFYPVADPSNN